jgi:hypothetical protein
MIDLFYIVCFVLLWIGVGVVTFRILNAYAPPDDSDQNFFLGLAVVCGPCFTGSVFIILFFVYGAKLMRWLRITNLFRKAAGL